MKLLNDHIKNVCKIGQNNDCCQYLIAGPEGFECAKVSAPELIHILDERVRLNTIHAQGDNCEGKENLN